VFQWVKMNPDFAAMYRAVRERLAADRIEAAAGRRQARAWRRDHEIALGLRPLKRGGKASTYSRAVARRVCARVAKGETMMSIVADPAMPSSKAIYSWLKREPEFAALYVAAREEQRAWLEFQIHQAVDDAMETGLARAKARVAHLEGRIGRLTPKTYRVLPRGWPDAAPVVSVRPGPEVQRRGQRTPL
jgi:hypothetical protein